MKKRLWFLAAMALMPSLAAAQPTTKWDAGASFGFVWGDGLDPPQEQFGGESANVAYNLDVGRYWTTHFKTDVGVLLTPDREIYGSLLYAAGPGPTYSYTETDRRLSVVSAAATYQFFENEFMHPYVSAGLQVGLVRDHVSRIAQTVIVNRVPTVIAALDERRSSTLVRPFVAAGCKSYFNERAFVRSELLTAVGSGGFSHATVRLGFGVDF